MASYTLDSTQETWEKYWPGDEYVDWVGYSYWANGTYNGDVLTFARKKNLPVFVAEITPRGFNFAAKGSEHIWYDWFEHFFKHIEQNKDVIKAISYINADWDSQTMWENSNWGNTKIQANSKIRAKWRQKMSEKTYVHTTKGTYKLIDFEAK